MLNLITDRTLGDVDRTVYLKAKRWQDMTAEERAEWASDSKGAYNASDLNRVEAAVRYVADQMIELGYPISLSTVTSWSRTSKPNTNDLQRYFNNVAKLRAMFPVYNTTPATPSSNMSTFNHEKANDLEKILLDVEDLLIKMAAAWFYTGDIFMGEVD